MEIVRIILLVVMILTVGLLMQTLDIVRGQATALRLIGEGIGYACFILVPLILFLPSASLDVTLYTMTILVSVMVWQTVLIIYYLSLPFFSKVMKNEQ